MNAFNGTAIKIWIYFLGSPKEAEDFQFTARLTGKDGQEVKYTGKVKSLETPIGDIERGFECLVVGQQTANELKNASDQLEIRLSICQKKHFNGKNNNFWLYLSSNKNEIWKGIRWPPPVGLLFDGVRVFSTFVKNNDLKFS